MFQVAGIGPVFKLKLALENTGKRLITNIPITFMFNPDLYKMRTTAYTVPHLTGAKIQVPALVPGLICNLDPVIECTRDSGGSENIRIFVCNPDKTSVPLITYIVNMPVSELFFDGQ